jgi:predicted nucleotidyltransferase
VDSGRPGPGQAGAGRNVTVGSGVVFTPEDRERLREELVAAARADPRVTAAAVTGSAAIGREDRWSDIDLALRLAVGADLREVLADWTGRMYRQHAAVDHLDVTRGTTLYRVFLLASTLQVDLAFWAAAEFGAIAPTFRLLFGTANDLPMRPAPAAADLIGTAWLHALHARSSIARGRVWQAEYMISAVRDQVLALACLRHGVPAVQGRGMDLLPPPITAALAGALVRSPETAELRRAFSVVSGALLAEIERVDAGLAKRLAGPLRELAS